MTVYGSGLYGAGTYGLAALYPTATLEWAPASGPTVEDPTWVDITDRLYEWEWTYGRNDETGEFEAGQGYVLLENSDRAFDPSYTPGPWYGNIKPRRQFRLRAQWNGTTYPVFRAHARSFPQAYPFETSSLVRVELADLLAILNNVNLDALGFDRPQELGSDRLDAIFDAADIDPGLTDFDQTPFDVGATEDFTEDLGSALDQVSQITEFSWSRPMYVNRDGKFTFD